MIIAEIGSVHDGSLGNAKNLALEAKRCGADYAKFQMHIAKYETIKKAPNPIYFKSENRFDYFNRTAFSDKQWNDLIKYCKKIKIKFLCSAFSIEAAEKLYNFGIKEIKIPSGELTNLPLIEFIVKKKFQVFVSTGMSNWNEIKIIVNNLKKNKVVLMQCTSLYPCPLENVGLNVIEEFKTKFKFKNVELGFSDHTQGFSAAVLAINYGAKYIEKHITFSKKMYGSDANLAMEIDDFKLFCKNINEAKIILKNKVDKNNLKIFKKTKKVFEKAIYLKKGLKKGHVIKMEDLSFKKPLIGIKAIDYKKVLGKKLKKNYLGDKKLNLKLFKKF